MLNTDSQSQSETNTTHAVISDGQFNIASQNGKKNIDTISKQAGDDTILVKADVENMLEEVKANQGIKSESIDLVKDFTDEAYRSQFIAEHRMFTFVTDENGVPVEDENRIEAIRQEGVDKGEDPDKYLEKELNKGANIYKLRELTDKDRDNLQKVSYIDPNTGKEKEKVVIAFNGILNDHQAAAKFAAQNYVATKGEDDSINKSIYKDIYFVHNPKTNNGVSELMVAGYQKGLEGNLGLGLGNSTKQAVQLMEQYGKDDLLIGAHSRGTLTIHNALRELNKDKENQDNAILSGTDMKMVGTATNLDKADSKLAQLQGYGEVRKTQEAQNHSIRVENHEKDLVAGFPVGFNNEVTTNTNIKNKGRFKIIKDIFGGDSSVHNCYGLGQPQCERDGYRIEGDLKMHHESSVYELNHPRPTKPTINPQIEPVAPKTKTDVENPVIEEQ